MQTSFTTRLFLGILFFVGIIMGIGVYQDALGIVWFLVVLGMMAGLLFRSYRIARSAAVAFNPQWREVLASKVSFYQDLDRSDQAVFEERVAVFFSTIKITAVDFELDDECRVLVAASSIVPFWDLPRWQYGSLQEVIVYSGHFDENYQISEDHHILGMVGSGGNMDHVMLLSKPALYSGFDNKTNKNHVGFHEFAHLLDKSDGDVDGIPELFLPKEMVNPWTKLVHREIGRIKADESDINPYGATSDAEFFAVISEYYHKRPHLLEKKHPDLFKMLQMIYRPQIIED